MERAEKCAEYMIGNNREGGVISYDDGLVYTFDTGIFILGMFDLFEISEKARYLAEAKKSLNCVLACWEKHRFAATDKLQSHEKWYHKSSVHLAKIAIPLIKASHYLEDKYYEKLALELLESYRTYQAGSGEFSTMEPEGETMTHPHCYATEGFLYAYWKLRKSEHLEIVNKAVNWLTRAQNDDGSFYEWYPISKKEPGTKQADQTYFHTHKIKVTDATAQAIRLWKVLGVNSRGIEKAYGYLNSQLQDGGLKLYGRKRFLTNPLAQYRVYSWPTFFCLHSLMLPFGDLDYTGEIF